MLWRHTKILRYYAQFDHFGPAYKIVMTTLLFLYSCNYWKKQAADFIKRNRNPLSGMLCTSLSIIQILGHVLYWAFHGFGQAKFAYGGSILGSSRFTLLPQLL